MENREKFDKQIVIVGVDLSSNSIQIAKENLAGLGVVIVEVKDMSRNRIEKIVSLNYKEKVIIILFRSDVVHLMHNLDFRYIDLAYHFRFKHHFSKTDKVKLDRTMQKISKVCIDSDDLNTIKFKYFLFKNSWRYPLLLNAGFFSCIRDYKRRDLKYLDKSWEMDILDDGYLRIKR